MIHRYAPESHQYINLLMKYYRLISLLFFFDKEIHLQEYIVKSFVVVEMQVYRVSVKILPYQFTVLFLKYLQRYVYRILLLFEHNPVVFRHNIFQGIVLVNDILYGSAEFFVR